MRELADALLHWSWTSAMGFNDVLTWWRGDRLMIGFRGNALSIENRALRSEFSNKGHAIDISMQTALSHEHSVEYWPNSRQIRGVRPQFMDEGNVGVQTILDGIEACVNDLTGQDDLTLAVLLPAQGEPWNVGDRETPYYSARLRKMLAGKAPAGLVDVVTREGAHVPGVDFCTVAPRIEVEYGGAIGSFRGRAQKMGPWFVTHSFGLDRRGPAAETSQHIASCGGLLFPSLAVGILPASVYGSCTLFARVQTVLQGLRPYKKRTHGRPWTVVTYTTDAWTGNTTLFKSDAAHELFQQLTGGWWPEYSRFAHMYVLGPDVSWEPSPFAEATMKIASTTSQVATVLTRRAKVFPRSLTQSQLKAVQETADRFPYLEAKVNGTLSLGTTVPLAACAKHELQQATEFLRTAGFAGAILAIDQGKDERAAMVEGKEWAQYAYAWRMRDMVLKVAAEQPWMIEEVLT